MNKIKDKDVGKSMMGNLDEIYNQIDLQTLEKLLTKDKTFKNRYLIDMIDSIFVEEMDSEKEKLRKLKKKIEAWARNNEMPTNVNSTYLKLEMDEEKIRLKQEIHKEETAIVEGDTQAQKLCKEYDIHVDYLNQEDVKGQVKSFCVNNGAFIQFKKSATIERALKNYNQYLERAQLQKMRDQKSKLKENKAIENQKSPSLKTKKTTKRLETNIFKASPTVISEYTNQYQMETQMSTIKKQNKSYKLRQLDLMSRSTLSLPKSHARELYYESKGLPKFKASSSDFFAKRNEVNFTSTFHSKRLEQIEKPYQDLEHHNHMHRKNIINKPNHFMRAARSLEPIQQQQPSNKMYFRSKSKVQNLLDQTYGLMKNEESAKKRIQIIDRELLEEQIKQNNFFKVAVELGKLNEQKPEYLKQFYDQAKEMDNSQSEDQVKAKIDYETSRLDMKLWSMLEKDRKKKQLLEKVKKAKGVNN